MGTGFPTNTVNWSDDVPAFTHNASQASRACETLVGPGSCATTANDVFSNITTISCTNQAYRWVVTDFGFIDTCGTTRNLTRGRASSMWWGACGGCGVTAGPGGPFRILCPNCWAWF